ncbi:DDB1- and CUL4-associated factor 6-like isoform X1 [Penaeus japonicus]|uniref:DDB1- and CUL4-associated factor 6-like isoform X1 n=1 Tax=Penaeus japonicus TaxID=27405 RepID=UPI001C70F63D|nr:DDB1- and CUL4-associated factor 6-like isoform X1 [Penaeus japonicus]
MSNMFISYHHNIQRGLYSRFSISGSEWLLQRMSLMQVMEVHRGCVNTVVWDAPGNLLLSGSDDQHLVICDPWERMTKVRIHTAHRANIFSAKFMPHTANRKIMSCSGDGILVYTDIEKQEETHDCKFTCHVSTCYDIVTLPDDPHTFLTCGEDGTVRWFDLRGKVQCTTRNCQEDILLNMERAVTAVAVNPITPYHLAVATQDSTIRIYDRRVLGTRATDSFVEQTDRALLMRLKPDNMDSKNHRVTSLRYSQDGREVLASYSSDYLYLFDTENFKEITLEGANDVDMEASSGPTLKRLRLRGDWSDTGPQALPECEMRNQAGDVGQARPTLHATLMQRMTDVLSRMLNDPGTRATVQRTTSESEASQNPSESLSENVRDGEEAADTVQHSESNVNEQPLPLSSMEAPSSTVQQTIAQFPGTSEGNAASESMNDQCCENEEAGERLEQSATHNVSEPHQDPQETELQTRTTQETNETPLEEEVEDTHMEDSQRATLSGLQDRLSSLRQGFVEKHQVEPSISLSYSGQGVSSGMISLGVGDEVTRSSTPNQSEQDLGPSLTVPSTSGATSSEAPNSEETSQSQEATKHKPERAEQPSCSSSSSSLASSSSSLYQPQAVRAHALTTSSSSPAICDMEVGASSSQEGRDTLAPEALTVGSSNRGAVASEINLGHTVDFGDDDSDDESATARSTSARMASAIERAVQRVKGERASGVVGDREVMVPQASVKQCYKGHRNARTMIKEACFWGDSHVMSGSDCGRVFVWERKTGRLVMLWEADRHVVNCLQPHPTLPVLATSGIDYDVKLWAPVCEESRFDEAKALEITRRNEALLEETRDTITVPATFMIRMLASLNQIRRGTGQVIYLSNSD